jgi:hypothetical protein
MNQMILGKWRNVQYRQGCFVYPLMSLTEHRVVAARGLSPRLVKATYCVNNLVRDWTSSDTYWEIDTAVVDN